jgi:cell division protein FtsI/penicillin-binding protein 2
MRVATLVICVLLLSSSCQSTGEGGEGPDNVANQLAAALSSKDVDGVPWQQTSGPVDLKKLLGGLSDVPASVEVTKVDEQDGTATATLAWSWDFSGHEWTYDSDAELVKATSGWQVMWAPSMVEPSLTDDETLDLDNLLPRRGDILGGNGKPLVTARDVVQYGLDKTKLAAGAVERSARRIAAALDIDPASYVKAVSAAGPKAFVEALVLRLQDARDVDPSYEHIPGAVALSGKLPLAPTREFAAPILGSVGPATAEIIQKSNGVIEAGDVVGLSGLQARYDEQLRGTPGLTVGAVDANGEHERQLYSFDATDGRPLRTTLDERLQLKAERILAGFGGENPANASAIVALRPSTGDVLVAANGPGAKGLNIATYGQYAPGSTFKIVSALALLRSGLTPDSTVSCPPTVVVDGKRFKNYDDYPSSALGQISLTQAVANSCNTAIIGQHGRLEDGDLADAAAALGLGVDHDLGFPAYFGQVPAPAGETEAAADMIGQGRVLASPLAMAAVAASVQAGRAVLPHLIPSADAQQTPPEKPLTAAEARQLRSLMRAVVTEGSGSILLDLPGEVGAKTGTAEYGEPAADGMLATHTWMIATQGDLAVAVFVETGVSGSGTAGPLLEAFLRR